MIQFELCRELGVRHPDYLLPTLSSKQMRDWEVFYRERPFGSEIGFYQAGIICYVLAEINRDREAKPTPYKPEDFVPAKYLKDKGVKKQSMEQMLMIMKAMSVGGGEKDVS